MDFAKSLIFDWYNAVFTAPIVFWIIYMLYYAVNPSDHDVGHEMEHDFDHEVSVESDTDVDHDIDNDVEHDAEGDAESQSPGLFQGILDFLQIGRCPFSIVMMILGISWGFIGLCINGIFSKLVIIPPQLYVWVSMVGATIAAVIVTRITAGMFAKLVPKNETASVSINSLVGCAGEASVQIDNTSGRCRVRDKFGTLHNVYCKTEDEDEPIDVNEEVLIVQYLQTARIFVVKRRPVVS